MLKWIKNHKAAAGLGGAAALGVAAFLAFGVFGVHTLFIDDVVSEDGPVFASGAAVTTEAAAAATTTTTTAAPAESESEAESETEAPEAASSETTAPETTVAVTEAPAPQIVTVATGTFIDRSHPAVGTINVLTDGSEQRFLRFEDDFATDNGPDLFVYLSRGIDQSSPEGEFDDDFIDLGVLKGNIGSQNYEIPADVDLSEYNTVSVWCRRFGVVFGAADLAIG